MEKITTAIIVGAGHRALIYADLSLKRPDKLKIVGVADMDRERRLYAANRYNIPENMIFESSEQLAQREKLADAIINGTMDHQHVATAVPLLKIGYDMILEKPFATNEEELQLLNKTVKENNNRVFICHVLRYSSFYHEIKQKLEDGAVGEILNIDMSENVSYHHMTVSYIRGKWRSEEVSHTSFLLAKSCHDIDLMMWFMNKTQPVCVSSFGSDICFAPDKIPPESGSRCLLDCPIESECIYSARKHYVDYPNCRDFYVWDKPDITTEEKINSLRTDNMYGKCVLKCGNNGVDHQSVMVNFANGVTGTFNLVGGTPKSERRIHITGSRGEISGVFEENKFTLRTINTVNGYDETVFDFTKCDGHGGGDEGLALDFCDYIKSGKRSISFAELSYSLSGHLVVFAAEQSRQNHAMIDISEEIAAI